MGGCATIEATLRVRLYVPLHCKSDTPYVPLGPTPAKPGYLQNKKKHVTDALAKVVVLLFADTFSLNAD